MREEDDDTCYAPVGGGLHCGAPLGECEHVGAGGTSSLWPTERMRVHDLVLGFFGGDEEKTREWMRAPNPLLGGVAPKDYLAIHPGRLLAFVERQLAENERE